MSVTGNSEHGRRSRSDAQQEKTRDCEDDSENSRERSRLFEEENSGDCHEGCATCENGGNDGERSAFLKQEKKQDRSCPDADSCDDAVPDARSGSGLVHAAEE